MWSLTCVPLRWCLELFETEAYGSDVPRSRAAGCGLLGATVRNQHIASVIVFTGCGQIQFSAAVTSAGAKPNDRDQAALRASPSPGASASGVQVRAVPGYKSGTNRITRHHPTSTTINKLLGRWMAISATKALVGIVSAALHQQTPPVPAAAGLSIVHRLAYRLAVGTPGGRRVFCTARLPQRRGLGDAGVFEVGQVSMR
jgi:hypothetical protein